MNILNDLGGGILLLQMPSFGDERGRFIKMADQRLQQIRPYEQRQLNYVVNKHSFTCRGLHYQSGPFAESKIFRVLSGSIKLVAFNVQPETPSYKQTYSVNLDQPDTALWVPRGFATGYCTLQSDTTVLYSSDNDYHPEAEGGIRWNDPLVQLDDLPYASLIISAKDQQWPDFQ